MSEYQKLCNDIKSQATAEFFIKNNAHNRQVSKYYNNSKNLKELLHNIDELLISTNPNKNRMGRYMYNIKIILLLSNLRAFFKVSNHMHKEIHRINHILNAYSLKHPDKKLETHPFFIYGSIIFEITLIKRLMIIILQGLAYLSSSVKSKTNYEKEFISDVKNIPLLSWIKHKVSNKNLNNCNSYEFMQIAIKIANFLKAPYPAKQSSGLLSAEADKNKGETILMQQAYRDILKM